MEESEIIQDRGSSFNAYAAKIGSKDEVYDMYKKIKYWYPEADHVVMAAAQNTTLYSCDDGEHNAGLQLENVLQKREENNVAVFVVKEFGSTKLGPKRFHHITEVATQALNKLKPSL